MAKVKTQINVSPETRDEAMKIALSTQKPGQTKEQTKLIAQGIQKGIAQYKKQQKAKSRESDKKHKKVVKERAEKQATASESKTTRTKQAKLPWVLLVFSWLLFAGFYFQGVL